MRIYLDTSRLDVLEKAARDPAQHAELGAFFAICREYGCQLVASRAHMVEIVPKGESADHYVDDRLAIMGRFGRILGLEPGPDPNVVLAEMALQVLWILAMRPDRMPPTGSTSVRYTEVVIDRMPPRTVEQLRAHLTEYTAEIRARRQRGDVLAEAIEGARRTTIGRDVERRTKAARQRAVTERAIRTGIPYMQWTFGAELDDVGHVAEMVHKFYRAVRARAFPIGSPEATITDEQARTAMPYLNAYDLPGLSYALALARARTRALMTPRRQFKANDGVDIEHMVFAPYVDVAFFDRETVEHIEQEMRGRPKTLAPYLPARVRRGRTIQEMGDEIRAAWNVGLIYRGDTLLDMMLRLEPVFGADPGAPWNATARADDVPPSTRS